MTQPQPVPDYPPETPRSHSHQLYAVAIIVLSVALVVSSATVIYFYEQKASQLDRQIQRTSDLNSQSANLQNQHLNLQNQNANLQSQINQLQNQVNSLRSELKSLKESVSNVTLLSGSVTTSGTPVSIIFYSGSSSTLSASSAVFADNSYFVILYNGANYTVKIVYVYSGTIYSCDATPFVYSVSSGPSASVSQNFFC